MGCFSSRLLAAATCLGAVPARQRPQNLLWPLVLQLPYSQLLALPQRLPVLPQRLPAPVEEPPRLPQLSAVGHRVLPGPAPIW